MPFLDSEYPSVVRGRDKRESQRLLAAAPELLAALKDLAYTAEAMSAYIPSASAKMREEYQSRTHHAWQCIRKAEGRSE